MAALVCDLCGGKLVMGAGGIAICDSCGMEHSTERMKEKVVEIKGTVDVSGSTIKVDTSEKLKNLYIIARRAKDENNFQDAATYYREIKLEDPNSWEAEFFSSSCTAINAFVKAQITSEKIAECIMNQLKNVIQIIKDHVNQEDQSEAYRVCCIWAITIGQSLCSAAKNTFNPNSVDDSMDALRASQAGINIALCAAYFPELNFNDYEFAKDMYLKVIEMAKSLPALIRDDKKIAMAHEHLDAVTPKADALKKKKKEEYWKEHAEEKQKYEARIGEIDSEINQLQVQIRQYETRITEINKDILQDLPVERQLSELKKQQSDLINQKSKLGLFAGKQKKSLQEQIDSLEPQINALNDAVKKQRQAIKDDVSARVSEVDKERKPIKDKISSLEKEKSTILDELNKDR